MRTIRIVFAILALTSGLRADRDTARVGPRSVASSDGAFFLLVTPVTERRDSWIWSVYAMGETGAFKEVWSRAGSYSREMFLSDDGDRVVCMDSWPESRAPKSDVVIAVFDRHGLVKSYRPSDILTDLKSVQFSVSHYRWLKDWPPLFARRKTVYFTTIEGVAYELDMHTGKISHFVE